MTDEFERKIRVQLITKLLEYIVTDKPLAISVNVRRYELSRAVNALLPADKRDKIAFDFLINGEFLRTSLATHIASRNIGSEEILQIEYVQSAPEPQDKPKTLQSDDWVSSIATYHDETFVSGSYDCTVTFWDSNGKALASCVGHTKPVTSIAIVPQEESAQHQNIVSGSQDETLRMWRREGDQTVCEIVYTGHTAAVTSVAVQPEANMICSGSWDNTLRLWNTQLEESDDILESSEDKPKRHKKKSAHTTAVKSHLGVLNGSRSTILTVAWPESGTIYSAGEDHCLRIWDVQSAVNVHTLTSSKVTNHIAVSDLAGLVAAADFDGRVRLYDVRKKTASIVAGTLQSHKAPAAAVAWSPDSAYQLVSGSYDAAPNNLKLWDIRSPNVPLFNIDAHKGKVLALAWPSAKTLISGGEDKTLKIHTLQSSSA